MKIRLTKFFFLFGLVLFCYSTQSFPQEKKGKIDFDDLPQPKEVSINVLVTDAQAKSVGDLKPEEFKLFEDNVEQKIIRVEKKSSLNLGIVIDNTGSIRSRLKDVTIAGLTLSGNLYDNDESFILRFVGSDKIEVLQDWTADKNLLKEAVKNLYIEAGQSAVIDALYLSAQKMAERARTDKSKRCALILISDGDERDSFYKLKDVLKILDKTNIQVFSLTVRDDQFVAKSAVEGLIDNVTSKTGGAAYYPKQWKNDLGAENDLAKALKSILLELHAQYTLSYIPTEKNFTAKKRSLKITVADGSKGEKRLAFVRDDFAAKDK